MKDRTIWFGRYEGWLRWLCKGVQVGDTECIKKSARLFDLMLPDECIVIPMPGHEGFATRMADVCHELQKLNHDRWWYDCLYSNPHEPNYLQKKKRHSFANTDVCSCNVLWHKRGQAEVYY